MVAALGSLHRNAAKNAANNAQCEGLRMSYVTQRLLAHLKYWKDNGSAESFADGAAVGFRHACFVSLVADGFDGDTAEGIIANAAFCY